MPERTYWADRYVQHQQTGGEAIGRIRPGQRVFIGSSCAEPQHLVRLLSEASDCFTDIEIVRLLALERTPLTLIANKTNEQSLNIRSFYLGSCKSRRLARNVRFNTPMNLSAVPRLFQSRQLPIQVALVQVSPPDDFGWMSLGISVDITLAAARSADLVIAQVNPGMPRVLGQSFVHVNDVDVFVEFEEPVLTVEDPPDSQPADDIGRLVSRLVEDQSTIHISPGAAPNAILLALGEKNDLGIHTQYLTDSIMRLVARGVITNNRKTFNEGKLVASNAIGSSDLYEFLHDNPSIEFHPSDYVNNPSIIARNRRMVSMEVAMLMDLTGQVAADALPHNNFCGVSGMLDFIRGSALSEGGKSIIMLQSTTTDGKSSRIVPTLQDTAVVVPRGDVHYVVSEFGAFNLFGKTIQERALGMISIAHPDFRDRLFARAKELGLLGPRRTLSASLQGVYPIGLEEIREIGGERVTIRPAKPVDERRIQEHFYELEKDDVVARFFHEKARFVNEEVEGVTQVDYIHNLTLVAVVGEFGFGRVVAVGEYALDPTRNLAEVAFSVSRDWQGRGLGKRLLAKLSRAARENGIAGLVAFTAPENQAMVRLFGGLPYEVRRTQENDILELWCRFDDPRPTDSPPAEPTFSDWSVDRKKRAL